MFKTKISTLLFVSFLGFFSQGQDCENGPGLADSNGSGSSSSRDLNPDGTPRTSTSGGGAQHGQACGGETSCAAGISCVEGTCLLDGRLRISMIFEGGTDIDLHVKTPLNEELYYRNREGEGGGYFIKDSCVGDRCEDGEGAAMESAIWPLTAPGGTYEVWAVNYVGGESVPFRIEVIENGKKIHSYNGTLSATKGSASEKNSFSIEGRSQDTACREQLDELGIQWKPWNYKTQYAYGKACTVEDPIRIIGSTVNGIKYTYGGKPTSEMRMTCELALAIHKTGNILKSHGVARVEHQGTFNCRTIQSLPNRNLSNHAHGSGMDYKEFRLANGKRYTVKRHFEKGDSTPESVGGRMLLDIGKRMVSEGGYTQVLGPNFNSDHRDHFHSDIKSRGGFR